jgi:hypothetical protein
MGTIAAGKSATDNNVKFPVTISLSANSGATTATVVRNNERM